MYYNFFYFQRLLDFTITGYSQFLWNRNLTVTSLHHILRVEVVEITRGETFNTVVARRLGLDPFHAPDVAKFTIGEAICFDIWG